LAETTRPPVTLSVILPVYNERKTIAEILERVAKVSIAKEIIVVDDGSTDGTREFLREHRDQGFRLILHDRNRGKGAGIRSAQRYVRGEFVVIQDADLELDPEDYGVMLSRFTTDRTDLVLGTRRFEQAPPDDVSSVALWATKLANRILSTTAGLLFGRRIDDIMSGYKMFRRPLFQALPLESDGFEIEVEMVARALRRHAEVDQVAVRYRPRGYADGKKIRWRHSAKIVGRLLKYRCVPNAGHGARGAELPWGVIIDEQPGGTR
jgi:glycosyltransferase involved in cell wall biosynthesis